MATAMLRWAATGVLAAAGPALAADAPTQGGWFVEAHVLDVESSGGRAPFAFDGEETGSALRGGYAFNRHFAIEGGYHRFGEHFATDCPAPICTAVPHTHYADIEGLSVAAVGTWHVTRAVEVFGKLGVLGWDADFELAGVDDRDRGALYGAGVGVWVSPRWRLNVQYERVDFDLESAGLGATYRF